MGTEHAMKQAVKWNTRQSRLLNKLIQSRGLNAGEYALFFVTGEGKFLPVDGLVHERIEEASGFVVDNRGRVFSFWLGWGSENACPELTDWEEVPPEPHWAKSPEYREAREQVGLSPD